MNYINKIYSFLEKKDKINLFLLVAFSIFVSMVEVVGVAAIMPFMDVVIDFNTIKTNEYYQIIFRFFSFKNEINFLIAFGLILIGFYILRGVSNYAFTYKVSAFTENLYSKISKKMFRIYIGMPYKLFSSKNSSYLTKAIVTEASLMTRVVSSALVVLSEFFVIVFLYVMMLIASWEITFIFTTILALKLVFLTKTVSKRIKLAGAVRAKTQAKLYEIINRVFGNFKHIKLQDEHRLRGINNDFSVMVDEYSRSNITNTSLNSLPRIFLETAGFSLIIALLIGLIYINQTNVSFMLPILSLFVLALYRLLPSVNRIVSGYNTLMFYCESVDIVSNELGTSQEKLGDKTIELTHNIKLIDIYFSYQEKNTLEKISLTIKKGEKIAFVGESGSGKSTLVDLICGLHQATKGRVEVDGVLLDSTNLQDWRSQIGYIPQQVYLFDGTIAENVCFGRKFNQALLERVLKQANIFVFLQTKQGINTLVGEGGIQLSGGQRQRAAIARALYGEPEILVLDEATSALDEETEKSIMNEIYKASKEKTLIVIAHRLSTIKGCNKIYEIKDGKIS